MKKIITPKISTTALVFVLGLVVAIFAFQVSKIYASKLSNSLQVDGGAYDSSINGNMTIGSPLSIGSSSGGQSFNVGGSGVFSEILIAPSGDINNPNDSSAFMTVDAVDAAVNRYINTHR